MHKTLLLLTLINAICVSGCASSNVYVDPSEVDGLGAVVKFPTGKIIPIQLKDVVSGSIIELTNNERVSYIGIYIPDVGNIAEAAKRLNESLVRDNDIRLEFDAVQRNAQAMLLAYVFTSDAKLVNAEIVRAGFAKVLVAPPNTKYKDRLLQAEEEARANGRGIWSSGF